MFKAGNVKVRVSDMERAVRFYRDTLGIALRSRFGDEWAELELPGLSIGLHPGRAPRAKGAAADALSIGLEVADLDATMGTLKAKGVPFAGEVRQDGPIRIAHFSDPDGNPLYLVQQAWSN